MNTSTFYLGVKKAYFGKIHEPFYINALRFIKKILGIYELWEVKVLDEPVQTKDSYTYKCAKISSSYYFLFIKIKTKIV